MVVRGATGRTDAGKKARFHEQHFSVADDELKDIFFFFFPFLFLLSFALLCFSYVSCFQAANSTNLFSFTRLPMRRTTATYMLPQRYKRVISSKPITWREVHVKETRMGRRTRDYHLNVILLPLRYTGQPDVRVSVC